MAALGRKSPPILQKGTVRVGHHKVQKSGYLPTKRAADRFDD
jgi:hypothetical protein